MKLKNTFLCSAFLIKIFNFPSLRIMKGDN